MTADYYPFGMTMPGRNTNTADYRYAYNGMEVDNEIKGNGNSYTTEFRQYDPRLGRWLSLDPLMGKYPGMSPFVAFNNNPIYFTDPKGLEGGPAKDESYHKYTGLSQNFMLNEFEKKLPTGVEVGTSFELNFQATKTGDRTRVGYTYQGGGVWNRGINGRGTKYVSENIKGNSSITSTKPAEEYLTDSGGTLVSTVSGNGGVGGDRSDAVVTNKGTGPKSNVTRGGVATDMGVKMTNNNPTPDKQNETNAVLNNSTSTATNTIDIASQVVAYSAEDAAGTTPKYAPKVADDASKILKVAKYAKVAGTVATVVDIGTNVVDGAIHLSEGNYSEAAESGTKAALGAGVAYGTAVATGAAIGAWGGPAGLVVGVGIAVSWAYISNLNWW